MDACSDTLHKSPVQPLTRRTLFCSILALQSCKGFSGPEAGADAINLWCCQSDGCATWNKEEVDAMNQTLAVTGPFEALTCFGADGVASGSVTTAGSSSRVVIASVVSVAAFVALLLLAAIVVWRHRKLQQRAREREAEMKRQMSNYQQQLEKEKEHSKNEKAELQKMKAQYKMLAMDLLANTGGSGDKAKPPPPPSSVRTSSAAVWLRTLMHLQRCAYACRFCALSPCSHDCYVLHARLSTSAFGGAVKWGIHAMSARGMIVCSNSKLRADGNC